MHYPSHRSAREDSQPELKAEGVTAFEYGDYVAEKSIAGLHEEIASGKLTCLNLCGRSLWTVRALNRHLHAVSEVNEEADCQAKSRDEMIAITGKLRPLEGIPLLIKDNIEARWFHNTAGSLALAKLKVKESAPVVKKLEEAGAVIIGKASMSEWAYYRSSSGISGWSAMSGRVRNPYAFDRSTYGSSSGTACGISAGMAIAGLGTETDGSILGPSSLCGIAGLKPTHGLLSTEGIVPLAPGFDVPGPMAQKAEDCGALLSVLTGDDKYLKASGCRSLEGVRLGVISNPLTSKPGLMKIFLKAQKLLQDLGARLVPVKMPEEAPWREAELKAFCCEFRPALNAYLKKHPECGMADLKAVIEFNRQHPDEELRFFDQDLFEAAQECALTEEEHQALLQKARRLAGTEGIDRVLADHECDALIAPETVPAWTVDYVNGDPVHEVSSSIAAVAGCPGLCVPMGMVAGLPVGLLFMGTRFSEELLLKIGCCYERARGPRIKPEYFKTLRFADDTVHRF